MNQFSDRIAGFIMVLLLVLLAICLHLIASPAGAHENHAHSGLEVTVMSAKRSADGIALEFAMRNNKESPIDVETLHLDDWKIEDLSTQLDAGEVRFIQDRSAVVIPKAYAKSGFLFLELQLGDGSSVSVPVIVELD